MPRVRRNRGRERVTYTLCNRRGALCGVTLWRQGAISFLWRGNVGPQLVFGDWWEAHPEAKEPRFFTAPAPASTLTVNLDDREISQAVVRWALNRKPLA